MEAAITRPVDILAESRKASGAALRTFGRIADCWELSARERQTILGLPRSTYFKVTRNPAQARLSRDTLERVSYVLGMYQALRVLLPRREAADAWIRKANGNTVFKGHAPIETMMGGKVSDLYVIRRYLDGERGW